MWTWVSESRNLSVYQDLSFLLRLTYGKLWNVESQRNEYIGKLYNTYKWRNVLSRFQIYPASFFLHTIDWLTWTKTQHLLKGNAVSWKGSPGSLKGAKHWKFTLLVFFVFFFFNNIFIITTLHLLPLLQISCWKKRRRTKDPGESWDSALIGKPFNIWKYNLTFLSIEEPSLLGQAGVGTHIPFSQKPSVSCKQVGAFPCIYIVLSYLHTCWDCTPPHNPVTTSWRVCKTQLPGRVQQFESPPPPQWGLHVLSAARKPFGSSWTLGTTATTTHAKAQLPPACADAQPWCWHSKPQWGGSRETGPGSHNGDTSYEPGRETAPQWPPPTGPKTMCSPALLSFLGPMYARPQMRKQADTCSRTDTRPPTGENKWKMREQSLLWFWQTA